MKILLMTVSAGQGHTAAAMAAEARLKQLGAAAHTIDVYQVQINRKFSKEALLQKLMETDAETHQT